MNAMNETLTIAEKAVEAVRVLLVEDDIDLSDAITEYLGKQGIAVSVEGRGDRALARIAEMKPDLVILDIMLPGKDVFDV